MSNFNYNPDRIPVLEEKYAKYSEDTDSDHMTVDELNELEWQRDMKATVISSFYAREAESKMKAEKIDAEARGNQTNISSHNAYDLGDKLASLRATRDAQRGVNAIQHGSMNGLPPIKSSAERSGLERLKKALG